MSVLFEDFMFCAFIVADILLLVSACRAKKKFSFSKKLRSIMFDVGFLFGLAWQIAENNLLGVIFCATGFMLSQFVVAVTFYQSYKDSEIPYE